MGDERRGALTPQEEDAWLVLPSFGRKRGPLTLEELRSHCSGVRPEQGSRIRHGSSRKWPPFVEAAEAFPQLCQARVIPPARARRAERR